jgi:VCBS repeat-containing protein
VDWTPNEDPGVVSITPEASTVLRASSINITATGSDPENHTLTAEFEYNYGEGWQTDYLSPSVVEGSDVTVMFTPPADAELGNYQFHVRFSDTYGGISPWSSNLTITVLNNPPLVTDMIFEVVEINRTDTFTLSIYGSDIDAPITTLNCELQYRPPTGDWIYLPTPMIVDDHWETEVSFSTDAELGWYDFRVRLNDPDGATSLWLEENDAVHVNNNPPWISTDCDDFMVIEDIMQDINLTSYGYDVEDMPSELVWSSDTNSGNTGIFTVQIIDGHILRIIPIENQTGTVDITLTVTDLDGSYYTKSDVTISVIGVNDAPVVTSVTLSTTSVYRTYNIYVNATAIDVETPQYSLIPEFQYRLTSVWKTKNDWDTSYFTDTTFVTDHWVSLFSPPIDAPLGNYEFRVRFIDQDGNSSAWRFADEYLTLLNNPPMIAMDCDDCEVVEDTETVLNLTPYGNDVEDPVSNLIWFVEYASIDLTLINAVILDNHKLIITPLPNATGSDDITLILRDSDGAECIKTDVTITVIPMNDPPITTLIAPINGMIINTTAVTLQWLSVDGDNDPITHELYLSDNFTLVANYDPQVKIKLTSPYITSYEVTGLQHGITYYWSVLPFDDTTVGECTAGIWQFEVNLTIGPTINRMPSVTLISPVNNSIVRSLSVTLTWHGSDPDDEDILTYDIYIGLDVSAVQACDLGVKVASNHPENSYKIDNLVHAATYYWLVIPYDGKSYGICASGVWKFHVNLMPEPVGNVEIVNVTDTTVSLSWSKPTVTIHFAKYELHKSTNAGFVPTDMTIVSELSDVNITTYVLTGLAPSTTYYIKIRVVNTLGYHADSDEFRVTTLEPEVVTAPGKPKREPAVDWSFIWIILEPLIVALTAIVAILGYYRFRRKRNRFNYYLRRIDDKYIAYRTNLQALETELLTIKSEIRAEFERGTLADAHLMILDKKLDDYLQEIREKTARERKLVAATEELRRARERKIAEWELPLKLEMQIKDMLIDGKITRAEYDKFMAALKAEKEVTPKEKREVERVLIEWIKHDDPHGR